MRILDIRERPVSISRYADPSLASGGLTTSILALLTDVIRDGKPVTGYGFTSIGRFAQGGLIRERFAPRLLNAREAELLEPNEGNLDPFRAWKVMMAGEKPGGHGERCAAVGTLDMAMWDAAAKIARMPLYRYLAERTGTPMTENAGVSVYAGGGYYYPQNDISRLSDEVRRCMELGYTHIKIKIGGARLEQDLQRIEAVQQLLPEGANLAVDAMNAYDRNGGMAAASALTRCGLWWLEDICDPLDFETLSAVGCEYQGRIAAGEALFSVSEAKLLDRHGGLRRDKDVLLFDPVHCYGLPGYLQIIDYLQARGWPRSAFWPHGGHLFCLHVAAGLKLGGAEANPLCFQPFGGFSEDKRVSQGAGKPPDEPGIGFETMQSLHALFRTLHRK